MSLLCETVTADSMPALLAARDAATVGDMIELRLDGVAGVDVGGALAGRRCPVVVTCRPVWEGGRFDGSEEERRRILERAFACGAEYVDVEWRAGFRDLVTAHRARAVLSSHDFDGVPTDLDDRVADMRASGAATVKLAVTPRRLSEMLPLAAIGRTGDAVVIGMGEAGLPSRLLAAKFGSRWTFAGNAVAPGQIPASRMLDEFRYRAIGAATRLFGVISTNAMHSVSPALHNAAFAAAGIDAAYVPLRAADFADFLEFADGLGIEGASVTIPFKLDALRAAQRADELTRHVGAANTLRRIRGDDSAGSARTTSRSVRLRSGRPEQSRGTQGPGPRPGGDWEATNTDIAGFLDPLEAAFGGPLDGQRAAVMGAGGSARAVIVALQSRGAHVTLHARRPEQAREAAAALGIDAGGWPVPAGSWDLLVNCTPLGGAAQRDVSPLPGGPFDGRLVYDLTYGPGNSALVREARAAGCLALDGLPMLIAQAERQFEWWTGQRPAAGVMRAAAHQRLDIAS
jgi:3-dehydroquinate dehydratase / shikimate dehydrogenase